MKIKIVLLCIIAHVISCNDQPKGTVQVAQEILRSDLSTMSDHEVDEFFSVCFIVNKHSQDHATIKIHEDLSPEDKRIALDIVTSAVRLASSMRALDTLEGKIDATYVHLQGKKFKIGLPGIIGVALFSYGIYQYYKTSRVTIAPTGSRFEVVSALSGLATVLPALLGTTASIFLIYESYKKVQEILEGVRLVHVMGNSISVWVQQCKEMSKNIHDLKIEYQGLKEHVANTLLVTQQLEEQMPNITTLSRDNATLAGIMKGILAQIKKYDEKFAKIQNYFELLSQHGNLPKDLQISVSTMAIQNALQEMSESDQKQKILQMYNKHGYSFMSKPQVDTFDEIPQEWFRKHEKELTKAGFTIHMHYI